MELGVADIFTISGAGIFLIFGLSYLYKSISLKNSCELIQHKISASNPEIRAYLFALMKVVAAATIALSTTIIYLQLQYAEQVNNRVSLIILISSGIFFLGAVNAMILIKRKTTIKPQIFVLVLGMLLIIAGYVVNTKII